MSKRNANILLGLAGLLALSQKPSGSASRAIIRDSRKKLSPNNGNGVMRVLVACQESQTVTTALRALGHEAFSCDIQPSTGEHPEWHIIGDAIELAYQIGRWDMLIAFPPCTYMCKGSAVKMYPHGAIDFRRYGNAMAAKEFFNLLINAPIDRIAIENPTPMYIASLPRPSQVIQPYEYGHRFTKRTCLWLKGLPLLKRTCYTIKNEDCPSWTAKSNSKKTRSKTFKGIAEAMADQWTK